MKGRYVLKNRRRFSIFIMIITVMITITILATTANGADSYRDFDTVVIERGDTLWDIAKECCSSSDIRLYIEKIKDLNDMSNSNIYEGDILKLPILSFINHKPLTVCFLN